ncbi:class I SAM-dependent methyltransferase [Roseovarius sp. 2305UL8-3]|uniref:class I SAM-dependent methyltransferase n=1 Tax=Roseovarius conchicola TaxID=3121636 RepID=UPI003527225E
MTISNTDQAEYWSSPSGQTWATHQEKLDTLMSGVLETVVARAAPKPGETILDIGCGTGASSLRLSDVVGQDGHVTGLDISDPLLDLARQRSKAASAANLRFVLGDAQSHGFTPATADLVFSRFGVMFFSDPVAAFANLLRAAKPGGRLAMICWQGAPENPWFMEPMKAAMARLGKPEPMDPHAPGPMAFKDIDRVTGILRDAGWAEAKGTPVNVDLIPPQSLEAAAEFATTVGPATRLMRERNGTEEDLAAIRADCTQRLAQYQTDQGLRVPAGLIVYTAVKA